METATLLYLFFAVFTALFLAVFQYIFKNKEKSQLNYWLSLFRFLSLVSIFVLIINPTIQKNKTETIKPNLLVAIDNSSSIKYNSQELSVVSFVEKIKNNTFLNSKFNINYYSFGTTLKTIDSLSFNEQQTNISLPFASFSKAYKKGINPVVLITDGNQTVGNNVEFVDYKSPVFPFIVGDTTIVEDIFINRLNVNKNTFINNQFPVEVFVNYEGGNSVSKKLNIYYNGKRVFSKQLHFSKNNNVQNVTFYLEAQNKGTQFYTAKIETLENEKNTINNTKNFSVNVVEEQSKIAILTEIVHPDLGVLKNAIESNKQRTVSILNINNFKDNITDYQLIILYQPTVNFKSIFEQIKDKKLNYFIISGLHTDWNFLNTIQSNFTKSVTLIPENYQPIFNENYSRFISDDIGFSTFAPLENTMGTINFSIPYNTLLFQKIENISTENPLLATFENNTQKGAVLFGENLWKWRMNSYFENKTFELFDGFIANLMQYLTSTFKSNRLNVSVKSMFFSNEVIEFSATYFDENLNVDNRAKIWLTVTNKELNYLNKIPFSLVNNHFIANLTNIPIAEYSYKITVENHKEKVAGSFKIVPFEIEQQFTQSTSTELKILASKTQGNVYYTNQEATLIDDLIADKRFKSTQKITLIKTPLIEWKWLLGFILFTLSVEWFTRKYYGKI